MLVDGSLQVAPLAAHPDVGLVDPDRSTMRLAEFAQPFLDQRCVGENPTVQSGMIHLQTALEEQLLDVTVAERIAQIPGDGLDDERRLIVPSLEVALGALLQFGSDGRQDHRQPPKSEAPCRSYGQRGVNVRAIAFATSPSEGLRSQRYPQRSAGTAGRNPIRIRAQSWRPARVAGRALAAQRSSVVTHSRRKVRWTICRPSDY